MKLPSTSFFSTPNSPITIFLHGFLGSQKNFTPLARSLNSNLSHTTHSLDLRNHGLANHEFPMNYTTMTNDVLEFCKKIAPDRKINIVGYSMGGKIGLNLALRDSIVEKLIVIDNAPINRELSSEFKYYLDVMKQLDHWFQVNEVSVRDWKQKGFKWLKNFELPSSNFALYLLDNYHWIETKPILKIPLYEFGNDVFKELGAFPDLNHGERFKGDDVLFLRAMEGYKFITDDSIDIINEIFNYPKIIEFNDQHSGLMVNHYKQIEELCLDFLK